MLINSDSIFSLFKVRYFLMNFFILILFLGSREKCLGGSKDAPGGHHKSSSITKPWQGKGCCHKTR